MTAALKIIEHKRAKHGGHNRIDFSEKEIRQIRQLAFYGLSKREIASLLEISTRTLDRKLKSDERVLRAFEIGRATASFHLQKKAYDLAMKGNTKMLKFLLKTRIYFAPESEQKSYGPSEEAKEEKWTVKVVGNSHT